MNCFLCKKPSAGIKSFTPEELEECRKVSKIRNELKLEYADVELPKDCEQGIGCHSECVEKFTNVGAHYCDSDDDIAKTFKDLDVAESGPTCSKYVYQDSKSTTSSNTSVKSLVFDD